MNRKNVLSGCLILAGIFTSFSASAYEIAGPLRINNRAIYCENEKPVIINDRILIPAEKVIGYGGIKSKFIESKNQIVIDSKNNVKRLSLYLDDPIMQVYTYKTVLVADREDIQLDVAPQMIDGTPMFPLRPVAEALGLDISWDSETDTVLLNTSPDIPISEDRCSLTIIADTDDVNTGDIVNITLKLSNTAKYNNYSLSAVTGSVIYDPQKFSFISTSYLPDSDAGIVLEASNGLFNNYCAKSVAVVNNYILNENSFDLMTLSFEALTDDGGEFILSDYYNTIRGADNDIVIADADRKSTSISSDADLLIDKTPIVIK